MNSKPQWLVAAVIMPVICLLFFSSGAGATEWYVNDTVTVGDSYCSAAGYDTQSGLTRALPKATISAVMPLVMSGDTVYVDAGTYFGDVFIETHAVTIIGADSFLTRIMAGRIDANDSDGLVLRRLGFYGNASYGIMWMYVDDGLIDECYVTNTLGVFYQDGANCRITRNAFVGNTDKGITLIGGFGVTDLVFADNYVANNANEGVFASISASNSDRMQCVGNTSTGNGMDGFFIDGGDSHIFIRNISTNNDTGFTLLDIRDMVLSQNQVDSNRKGGYEIDECSADTVNKNNFLRGVFPGDFAVKSAAGNAILDFRRNYWNTADSAAIRALIQGAGADSINWVPYRLGRVDTAANVDTIAPAAPDSVAAVADAGNFGCTISWSAAATSEEIGGGAPGDLAGYRVYRATSANADSWGLRGATVGNVYYDSGLTTTTYYYRVTAYDNHAPWENESWYSDSRAVASLAPNTSGPNMWYVNIAAGDTANDGLSAGTAKKYLGSILASRNRNVSLLTQGDTVNIAAGTYNDTINVDTDYIWILGADSTTTILSYGDSSLSSKGDGINADTRVGLVIRDLRVTNCRYGIDWLNVDSSRLDRVAVVCNGSDAIYLEGCDNNDFTVYAYANDGSGIYLQEADGNRFTNCTVDSSGSAGYMLIECDGNTFSGNTLSRNYLTGYVDYGISYGNLVSNSLVNNNGVSGIEIYGGGAHSLVGNTIRQNSIYGLALYCDSSTILRNLIQNTFGDGLILSQGSNNLVVQNTFDSNADYAIDINLSVADTVVKNIFIPSPANPDSGVASYDADTAYSFLRNYWSSTDSAAIAADIRGPGAGKILWQPFRLGRVDTAANADTVAPAAPAIVGAWTRGGACTLTWSASTTNEEPSAAAANVAGYNIYRSRISDTSWWAPVGSTAGTIYCDSGLVADTLYYYRVTAYDNHAPWPNESWYSEIATVIDAPGPNAWYVNDTDPTGDSFCSALGADTQSGFARATPKRRISDVLLAASAGDSIYIDAGTYYETCIVTANGVSLIGADSRSTIIDGSNNGVAWDIGVYAAYLYGLRVENLQIRWSNNGVVFDTVGSSVIRGDSFTGTASDAIWLAGADSNVVEYCQFSDNGGWSFNFDDAKQNIVRNNLISTTSGYLSPGADSCLISGNVLAGAGLQNDADSTGISSNSFTGNVKIDIASGTACVITGNTFSGAGGILVQGGVGHTVAQNIVSGYAGPNRAFEFYLNTETCNITGNLASGGNHIAFEINGSGHTVSNNVARDNVGGNADGFYVTGPANTLTQNDALRNGRYGFRLAAAASGNVLQNNRSESNTEQGIVVQSAGNTLAHNRVAQNRKDGIMLFSGLQNTLLQNTMDSNAWYGLTISASAASCTVGRNNILTSPLLPDSGVWYDSSVALDLSRTWWGTTDSAAIRARINGSGRNFITYTPARLGTIDTVANADTIAPAAPVVVTISGTSILACTIAWSASAVNEEIGGAPGDLAGYRVYRSTTSGTTFWAPIGTTAAGDTDYVDTAVGYMAYYYRVTAFDNHSPWPNESWYSDSIVLADLSPPDTSGPNVWYVNVVTGDTGYLGLTADMPKKYLGQVFAARNRPVSLLTAGDTVYIAAGTYTDTISIDTNYIWVIGADSQTTTINYGDSSGLNPGPAGISVDTRTGIVIRDLGVTNILRAIRWRGVTDGRIENTWLRHCGRSGYGAGIDLGNCTAVVINNNNIYWCGNGMDLFMNSGLTVTNNLVDSNCTGGIFADLCPAAVVTGNTLRNNWGNGLESIDDCDDWYVANNTVTGNHGAGIYSDLSDRGRYVNNLSTGNGTYGYELYYCNEVSFVGGRTTNNRAVYAQGYLLWRCDSIAVSVCDIDSNGAYAVYIESGTANAVTKCNLTAGLLGPDSVAYIAVPDSPVNLVRNWWGTTDSAVISGRVHGPGAVAASWLPFRLGRVDTAANADTIAPTAPDSVTVVDSSYTTTSCTINFAAASSNEEIGGGAPGDLAGYRIYRSRTNDTSYWAPVGTTAATSYVATGLVAGETYYFRVTAYDNHSPWANESWYSDTIVRVVIAPGQGDFINSGTSANQVDTADLNYLNAQVALYWGAAPADIRCDLDGDGILDFDDLTIFAMRFGS